MDNDLKRIAELLVLIEYHDKKYHGEDSPEILDSEYDDLIIELRLLERKYPDAVKSNSPTKRVGYEAIGLFEKAEHSTPMYSLNNAFNEAELKKFDGRVTAALHSNPTTTGRDYSLDDPRYIAELKYDGLSIDLQYVRDNGLLSLHKAITRGDGMIGEDVSHNVMSMEGIPFHLPMIEGPYIIEVRGEIVMTFDAFEKHNAELREKGLKEKVNPRNAAAGGVRNSDPEAAGKMGLMFIAYQINDSAIPTQKASMHLLNEWGFNTMADLRKECTDIHEMMGYIDYVEDIRSKLPFPIDGVVFKVNNKTAQSILGYQSRAPKFAIAYKYPAEEARTTVEAIELQVGRTGAITPVARITPVFVGGVTVSNVTLHNENDIRRKDIRVGDEVIVCRAGDVIPAIRRVELNARENRVTTEFVMPKVCLCGSPLHKDPKEAVWRCTGGRKCEGQLISYFINAYGRDALNIQGLGDKTIEEMVEKGMLRKLSDIYFLSDAKLYLLDETGDASVEGLRAGIEISRNTTMERVLQALGVRHVGKGTSKRLAAHFKTMSHLIEQVTDVSVLEKIEDIGPTTAASFYDFLSNASLFEEMMDLVTSVTIVEKVTEQSIGPKDLIGQTFVITGSFIGMTRDDVAKIITDRGGKVSSTVSTKTTCLLMGEEPGKSKVTKAQQLGIRILESIPGTTNLQ